MARGFDAPLSKDQLIEQGNYLLNKWEHILKRYDDKPPHKTSSGAGAAAPAATSSFFSRLSRAAHVFDATKPQLTYKIFFMKIFINFLSYSSHDFFNLTQTALSDLEKMSEPLDGVDYNSQKRFLSELINSAGAEKIISARIITLILNKWAHHDIYSQACVGSNFSGYVVNLDKYLETFHSLSTSEHIPPEPVSSIPSRSAPIPIPGRKSSAASSASTAYSSSNLSSASASVSDFEGVLAGSFKAASAPAPTNAFLMPSSLRSLARGSSLDSNFLPGKVSNETIDIGTTSSGSTGEPPAAEIALPVPPEVVRTLNKYRPTVSRVPEALSRLSNATTPDDASADLVLHPSTSPHEESSRGGRRGVGASSISTPRSIPKTSSLNDLGAADRSMGAAELTRILAGAGGMTSPHTSPTRTVPGTAVTFQAVAGCGLPPHSSKTVAGAKRS